MPKANAALARSSLELSGPGKSYGPGRGRVILGGLGGNNVNPGVALISSAIGDRRRGGKTICPRGRSAGVCEELGAMCISEEACPCKS